MPEVSKLKEIKQKLKNSQDSEEVSVRSFLEWFHAKRRGTGVVEKIKKELKREGLMTTPDFESAYIDSKISIKFINHKDDKSTDVEIEKSDPTYKLSKLAAANNAPKYVNPQDSLTTAVTIMLAHDYSQLPVMKNERDVIGLISWKVIGSKKALNQESNEVKDFMEPVKVVSHDDSIFSVIEEVRKNDCILVKNKIDIISGIITGADLGEQFGILSKPFLILGEIENYIRKLIDGKFKKDQLQEACDPSDNRKIESASDLTFGEYVRLLEKPDYWDCLKLNIDRKIFKEKLDEVRIIRNSVMHFDPDGIEDNELDKLNQFCEFMRSLEKFGAI